ncbi:MAG: hypothetical protein K2J30_02570 [Clostridia bacterium]|nr:hypothetical protein [Clostridia bacterium]
MKKILCSICVLVGLAPALTGCGGYDYFAHVSEIRSDIFCAETEEFSLTLSCTEREYPYASDGIACSMSKVVEISVNPIDCDLDGLEITFTDGKGTDGDAAFRNTHGDYFYSFGVTEFPTESVSLSLKWNNGERELTATSVKNEQTMTAKQALDCAISAEKDKISRMTRNKRFYGEFYVRLLRRNVNYYYVGIVDENGNTLSLLLDSESGDILARREN